MKGKSIDTERDVNKTINKILDNINEKSVANGKFELNPLALSGRYS